MDKAEQCQQTVGISPLRLCLILLRFFEFYKQHIRLTDSGHLVSKVPGAWQRIWSSLFGLNGKDPAGAWSSCGGLATTGRSRTSYRHASPPFRPKELEVSRQRVLQNVDENTTYHSPLKIAYEAHW